MLHYRAASLALFKLAHKTSEKIVAMLAFGVVVGGVFIEGETLAYPAVLALMGYFIGSTLLKKERA